MLKLPDTTKAIAALDPLGSSTQPGHATLFGSPVIMGTNGQMVVGRRARAIIGYLLLSDTPRATRERLVGLFWPDRGDVQARASLRQCLVELRGAFGEMIVAGREWITLDDTCLDGDWPRLKAALAGNDALPLARALTQIGAEPLLDGMEFGDSFDTWLRSIRALLDARICDAVARLVDAVAIADDGRTALALADAWLVRNPVDEVVATGAIRIEMQQGAVVSAKRRYREFETVLMQEGHGVPGAAMRAALDLAVPANVRQAEAPPQRSPAAQQPTIAVLPFDNLSSDVEMAYFSDGVSEDILSRLIRGSKLKVIGRISSFQFRGADKPMAAAALNATHILDGSIRRAGSKVRITAHLVAASGATLWSEHFDRNLEDIFAVQDEISEAIAGALQTAFFPEKIGKINPAAYDLYLQARAVYSLDLTWANQKQCVDLLAQAVSLAPDFAEAWGRLAVYRNGEAAIAAGQRGLEIDPDCAIALAALAMTKPSFANHAEKLRLAERAYRLAADDQLVAGIFNMILLSLGLLSPGVAVAQARFERDPLSPMVAGGLAMLYRSAGLNREAISIADNAVRDFAESGYSRFVRGVIAIYNGDIACAEAMADTDTTSSDVLPLRMLTMFMRAVAAMSPADRAVAVGGFLNRNAPKSFIVDIGLAAAVGEAGLAMDHLLAAIIQGRPLEFTSENDGRATTEATVTAGFFLPNCEVLRRDVRFAEVCVRLGLYDCWRDTDLWPDCAAEVSEIYDFKAECARLSGKVARYVAAPIV